MPDLNDLLSTRNGFRAATEHAEREQEAADAADRREFERVFRELQTAMRDADAAYAQLQSRKARAVKVGETYHASLGDRAAELTAVSDAVTQLRIDLANRLSETRANIDALATPGTPAAIEQLGEDLRTDLKDAQDAADAALDDYYDKLAVAQKQRVALRRIERRVDGLVSGLETTLSHADKMLEEAGRNLARTEDVNNRVALVWYYFARRDQDRIVADFDDDGFEVGAGGAAQFSDAFVSAWDDLVAAEAELHDAALDLHRARLEEVIAGAALRQHETSLPFAFDDEIVAAIAALP